MIHYHQHLLKHIKVNLISFLTYLVGNESFTHSAVETVACMTVTLKV